MAFVKTGGNALNARLARDYGMWLDADAMVRSDLTDPYKFHPPGGRFYLASYQGTTAGAGA